MKEKVSDQFILRHKKTSPERKLGFDLVEFENFWCLLLTGSLLKLKDVTSDFMGVSEHVRLK